MTKSINKLFSSLALTLFISFTFSSLVMAATPVKGTDFIVFQNFDTEALQNQAGPVPKDNLGNDHDTFGKGIFALAGQASFSVKVDRTQVGRDFLMKTPPAPTIATANDAKGVFCRLKTTVAAGANMYLELDDADVKQWSHLAPASVWVTEDGTIYRGVKTPIANFSGYVFFFDATLATNPPQSVVALNLFNGANDVSWNGSLNLYDNVGYYKIADNTADNQYKELAAAIYAAYPDNPETKLYITYETGTEPATAADAKCGIKPKLTANIFKDYQDKTVKWSVVEGDATIIDLAGDDAATSITHSCYVNFKNSGKVIIRAAMKAIEADYVDFTFTVSSDSTPLNTATIKAKLIEGTYRTDTWDALQAVITKANLLLDKDNEDVTQKEYDDMVVSLKTAENALIKVTATATSAATSTTDEQNPQTGANPYPVWAVILLILSSSISGVCIYIGKCKVSGRNA